MGSGRVQRSFRWRTRVLRGLRARAERRRDRFRRPRALRFHRIVARRGVLWPCPSRGRAGPRRGISTTRSRPDRCPSVGSAFGTRGAGRGGVSTAVHDGEPSEGAASGSRWRTVSPDRAGFRIFRCTRVSSCHMDWLYTTPDRYSRLWREPMRQYERSPFIAAATPRRAWMSRRVA
jgi:hypothetical protein